jgi:hypothetical protein
MYKIIHRCSIGARACINVAFFRPRQKSVAQQKNRYDVLFMTATLFARTFSPARLIFKFFLI